MMMMIIIIVNTYSEIVTSALIHSVETTRKENLVLVLWCDAT